MDWMKIAAAGGLVLMLVLLIPRAKDVKKKNYKEPK